VSPSTASAPLQLSPTASPVARVVAPPRRKGRFALLGHAPALDGLRGLAVVLVLVFHFAGHSFLHGGSAGVDVFFCLSGFLITALILDERRVHGRLSVGRFYARRACRLLPALFVLLAVWSVMLLLFHDQTWMGATPSGDGTGRTIDVAGALRDLGVAVVYLANWNVISGGMEAPLPHLWSLAVEEQFYLVWPATLLALLLLGKRARLVVLGLMLTVSAALPWLYWNGGAGQNRIYFGTDTRAVGLLAGAFCALVWHERHALGRTARYATPRALAGLAFVVVICLQMGTSAWKFVVLPSLLALAVSQLVPHLVDGRGLMSRAFSTRALVWAGKRSYGIYLWQYVWATWMHPLGLWPGMALGVLGTLACTQLSWHFVEAPILSWSKRFRPGTAPARPALLAAA
jgi:peptidoglycan/LPS O-acetylase OafA/YrhL